MHQPARYVLPLLSTKLKRMAGLCSSSSPISLLATTPLNSFSYYTCGLLANNLSPQPSGEQQVAMADNNQQPAPPPVAVMPDPILHTVCLWASLNAVVFGAVAIIALRTPCDTKSTRVGIRCVPLTATDAAAAELSALLHGELVCSTAAGLAALLHMVLRARRCCAVRRWAADALAWVALAATAGAHSIQVASGGVGLATRPVDNTYFVVDVVLGAVCLPADLLAGVIVWCSCSLLVPRPCQLGEQQQGQGDGQPV